MTSTISVFYDPAQVSHPTSFSPSAAKPAALMARWQDQGLPIKLVAPQPLSRDQLALAHHKNYVNGVLDLKIANGFHGKEASVASSLLWTTGSMLAAARHAVDTGRVAVSPTSGFHHAGYAQGGGFCTFNGLMIAALALREEGRVHKVAILDCDEHYGDGTDDIIQKLWLDGFIAHVTTGYGYTPDPTEFLARLPSIVAGFSDCDLVLYQAGADPHVDDPLGGWLTTPQLRERDRLVFATARQLGLPIAWNLAGGYQEPVDKVLAIHDNTMLACIAEYTACDSRSDRGTFASCTTR